MNRKEIFSKNLNSILEARQEKQIDVAKIIGVSQQTFNNWCTGVAIPRMDKIQTLADYFHVPMSALIEDKQDSSSSLSNSADEIAKAVSLYNEYIKANPDIQRMVEYLLKISQSMPNLPTPELPMLNELKRHKPTAEFPCLKKDNDK